MEIVSEGSLESISRPASCDSVRASKDLKKHGQTMGFLEELPPEVVAISLDEDIESEDELIISPLENDVIIEDIQEWSTTAQSTDPDDSVDDDDDNASEGDALDTNNGKVKRSSSPQDELESVPVTPVFATQLSFAPSDCSNMHSPSDRCTEQDIDEVQSKSSKKTPRKKKGNKARAKEKEQNFVKRNIELAADAGSLIPMTEAEKKRLEELLSDETDLLMVENAYVEGLTLPAGEGFTKLQDLVPQVEMDLLASHESWKSITDSKTSSHDAESVKDVEKLGLGERILGEDKEMREMKRRLVAIEADLQALYRDDNNESEVGLSDEILAKLIGDSSRTTSHSNTISESVISALSSSRSQETTPIQTPASIEDNQTNYARSDIIRSASAVDTREDRTRSQQSSSTLEHD
ncbi:Fibrous sheath-interacting protein 1 [Acropora cervicornis]|uniref:Fibrous sheath-interacting protein 1 n=1 Tax=Acropora cervicornis TaxID=6130 RepID=A0AAD9Q3F9_ACRCE|nr:Fibrous sheath-interacting protein 1 [Acropora cervicornis]